MLHFPERTHLCGNLRAKDAGRDVLLYGWVYRVRDMGGILFLQVRDVAGLVQVVVGTDAAPELRQQASALGQEWVVRVKGAVRLRGPADVNKDLGTGEVEVVASSLEVLSKADVLPFPVDEKAQRAQDVIRMQYRYLDLRRPEVASAFKLRSKLYGIMHAYMQAKDFLYIDTPELCKSTPEGARDFLVPSRRELGTFYALPQSPQLFKQLLMVAGFDRYYQVARCFRDEDFRADRSVEFSQLDIETSFTSPDGIFAVIEGLFREIARGLPETGFPELARFDRIDWVDAVGRYGSDKPDLRYGLELKDLVPWLKERGATGFRALDDAVALEDGTVRGIVVPGAAERYSRSMIDALTEVAKKAGAKGLLTVKWGAAAVASPLVKALGEDRVKELVGALGGAQGDLVLLAAGPFEETCVALGTVRQDVARTEKLIPERGYAVTWVVQFPWLEKNAEGTGWTPRHHPFTKPILDEFERYIESAPGKIHAQAYDLVVNGYELGGGSVRIHTGDLQKRMFDILHISPEAAQEKFGFLLDALRFGAPPHAGIALGIDRLAAILAGKDSIRDVIAFPKSGQGKCMLTGAPTFATPEQLKELGLDVKRS